jgi:hypothetical protein
MGQVMWLVRGELMTPLATTGNYGNDKEYDEQ